MPHEAENSDHPSTLPAPELNPLLNPLLAQNMGRWAEVYFTSPPDKREQAVLELLHQLEAESAQRENGVIADPASEEQLSATESSETSPVAEPEPELIRSESLPCQSCGHENSTDQRFCGMCGVLLDDELEPVERQIAEQQIEDVPHDYEPATRMESGGSSVFSRDGMSAERRVERTLALDEPVPVETVREILSNDDTMKWGLAAEAAPSPYRGYIGAGLAILILSLAYVAWRSTQATSGMSHTAPQPPPATASQPEAPAPAATPSVSNQAESNPTTIKPVSASAAKRVPAEKTERAAAAPIEKTSQAPVGAGNGSEELAMAQSYLNGANGRQRDSAQAAGWLWKAVAKKNADATLLLSDLYLKGDGVSKSCDQARVLLDAAARKGAKGAGEQLRHLQAFGCE